MKVEELKGRISKENIKTLQKYVQKVLKVRTMPFIVDIGTLGGMSAITMAVVSPDVTVYTIDPNCSPAIKEQCEAMEVSDRVHYYQMNSEEFAPICPEEIDLCFIDGQHDYLGVKADIENIGIKVRKGGFILFHDVNLYFNTIGKAVREFDGIHYKFVEEVGGLWTEDEKQGSIWVGERI